jgi:hypothetical protein
MVPNHLFTLLSMVAMEPPTGIDAAAIHSKKAEVLAAMSAVEPARAVRGQYGAGTVLGKKVSAYRQEPNVAPDSSIETYVAIQLEIDNWQSASSRRPTRRSGTLPSILRCPTGWCCAFLRMRESPCSSRSSVEGPWRTSPPSRWTSTMMTGSRKSRTWDTRR